MGEVWLSEDIFKWRIRNEGGVAGDARKTRQPYRFLSAARQSLETSGGSGSADLIQACLLVTRAVQHRLDLIERYHQLTRFFPTDTGPFERLEALGLAKPVLTRHLRPLLDGSLREGSSPPVADQLKELLDIAWYFLKATDPVCALIRSRVTYVQDFAPDTNTPPLQFTAEIAPLHTQQLRLFGWFSGASYRMEPAAGYPLKMQVTHTQQRELAADLGRPVVLSETDLPSGSDLWLDGTIEPSHEQILGFWITNFAQ